MAAAGYEPGQHWPRETITLREHLSEMHACEEKLEAERDRRYAEVDIGREKAIRIKEEADKMALDLARQIQTYKDERANQLREQINSERGSYATKNDLRQESDKIMASIKPLVEFMATQQGSRQGTLDLRSVLIAVVGIIIAIASLLLR